MEDREGTPSLVAGLLSLPMSLYTACRSTELEVEEKLSLSLDGEVGRYTDGLLVGELGPGGLVPFIIAGDEGLASLAKVDQFFESFPHV